MIAKARLPVDALCARVRTLNFQVQRRDAFRSTDFGGELDGRFTDPTPAKIIPQEDFVNESVAPVKLKAEAERNDEIARCLHAYADQVDDSERTFIQNLLQRRARRRFVECQMLKRVKLPHQLDEQINVRRSGQTKNRLHSDELATNAAVTSRLCPL